MEALKQIEAFFAAKISIIKTLCSIIILEARLAGLSVFPLLLNICMLFVVLITVWLTTMCLVGYFVFFASDNLLLSIFLILLFNLGLLLGLIKYLSFNLKSLSFQKTREYFSLNQSDIHEKLKKADNSANCNNG